MIHDAYVKISCDGDECDQEVEVGLDYVYSTLGGGGGRYDDDEDKIERRLVKDHHWTVARGDDDAAKRHLCESCQ